ncbi:YggS family pyridoxal phosphate-dependent enzyme [Helicobacter labetoulli]|uniref:YggS family pyridoxal phosphate-dependent enzyme n=1 Tax=Helicobacter labetoulli TaxID=2315333 RepID=UPI000EF6DC78|nr:YggS family pyridoxal phosphate-dependent enzyme [Helicobacter labetoulli]
MLALQLERILRRIERARLAYDAHQIISLVAVSKYQSVDSIRALYECGQRAFGENKVQDLRLKAEALDDVPLEWHFIGKLQENKINALLALKPSLIHSVDSLKTAQAIQKRLQTHLGEAKVRALLQINAANEESKSGVSVEAAKEVYEEILSVCPNLIMEGVMCIGANSPNRSEIEKSFQKTSDIFHSLQDRGAKILSMGMSGDFEIAIAYGANLVRIGSKLFETKL